MLMVQTVISGANWTFRINGTANGDIGMGAARCNKNKIPGKHVLVTYRWSNLTYNSPLVAIR